MRSMIQSVEFDLEALRKMLQDMPTPILKKFGEAAAYMASPKANQGEPPRQVFVIQLREARAEWKRRQRIASDKTR